MTLSVREFPSFPNDLQLAFSNSKLKSDGRRLRGKGTSMRSQILEPYQGFHRMH